MNNQTPADQLLADAIASVTQAQQADQQPQAFVLGGQQFESREQAEKAIASYVAQQQQETARLKAELEEARKSAGLPQQQPQAPASQSQLPAEWDTNKWTNTFVEDPRKGVGLALGHAAFGTSVNAAEVLRALVANNLEMARRLGELESVRETVSDWQYRASHPEIPWDNQDVKKAIDEEIRNRNLPKTKDTVEFAVYNLQRQGKLPTRDQWVAAQQQFQQQQGRANVQQMRPQGLPSVGPSQAQMATPFDLSKFEELPEEQQLKVIEELRRRERQMAV